MAGAGVTRGVATVPLAAVGEGRATLAGNGQSLMGIRSTLEMLPIDANFDLLSSKLLALLLLLLLLLLMLLVVAVAVVVVVVVSSSSVLFTIAGELGLLWGLLG